MFSFSSRISILLKKKSQGNAARGMATLKTISIRLKSVKNIQKITQSMKMVSAAKFSRAEKDLKQIKPLGKGAQNFYKQIEEEKTELPGTVVPEDPDKKILYIAVTSDRGLCGGVHSSVAKVIKNVDAKIIKDLEKVKIVCIGDKARSLLHRFFQSNILFVCNEIGRVPPTFGDASKIANEILQSEFKFDVAEIVYNRFKSIVSYSTESLTISSFDKVMNAPKLKVYDEISEEDVMSFVEFSLATFIFYAMKEAACSEQASRMTSMDNASKNAGDMISKLTLTFNRTRQAVITRELIEIISGASAL